MGGKIKIQTKERAMSVKMIANIVVGCKQGDTPFNATAGQLTAFTIDAGAPVQSCWYNITDNLQHAPLFQMLIVQPQGDKVTEVALFGFRGGGHRVEEPIVIAPC